MKIHLETGAEEQTDAFKNSPCAHLLPHPGTRQKGHKGDSKEGAYEGTLQAIHYLEVSGQMKELCLAGIANHGGGVSQASQGYTHPENLWATEPLWQENEMGGDTLGLCWQVWRHLQDEG